MSNGEKETKQTTFTNSNGRSIESLVEIYRKKAGIVSKEDVAKFQKQLVNNNYDKSFDYLNECIILLDRLETNMLLILEKENIEYINPIESIRDVRKKVNFVLDQMRGQNPTSDTKFGKVFEFQIKLAGFNNYILGFLRGQYVFQIKIFKRHLNEMRVCSLRI